MKSDFARNFAHAFRLDVITKEFAVGWNQMKVEGYSLTYRILVTVAAFAVLGLLVSVIVLGYQKLVSMF